MFWKCFFDIESDYLWYVIKKIYFWLMFRYSALKTYILFISVQISVVFLHCSFVYGQNERAFMDVPQKFILPLDNVDYKEDTSVMKGSDWVVYSDRQYNKTYTKANGNDVKYIIDFLARFVVGDRDGRYLNIYKYDSIKDGFIDYGWIDMDNLLLWNHALISPSEVNIKAIIVKNNKNRDLFQNQLSDTAMNFAIFHVYKYLNNSVLIGRRPNFFNSDSDIGNCIVTWIPTENIWIWKAISAIEPVFCTSTPETELQCKPSVLRIYSDRKSVKKFRKNYSFSKNQLLSIDRADDYWTSVKMRFPLIAVNKDNIAEVVLLNKLHVTSTKNQDGILTGFTPIDDKLNKKVFFNEVLLYSSKDIAKINTLLSALSNTFGSNVRQQIYEVWFKILEDKYYGVPKESLLTMKMSSIHNVFFHKQLNIYLNENIRLGQLLDSNFVSEKEIISYVTDIKESHNHILNMLNEKNYKSVFLSNGVLYYWIDSKMLP